MLGNYLHQTSFSDAFFLGTLRVKTVKCVISTAILDSTSPTSTDGKRIRKEIWEFSLIDVLILVLKHDYSIIEGQWMTAAKLTTILRYITRSPDKSANLSCDM